MLIFNSKKELIDIEKKDLDMLGFSSLEELLSYTENFADLFAKEAGHLQNFLHVHWIDFLLCSDDIIDTRTIIKTRTEMIKCFLEINPSKNEQGESIYLINIKRDISELPPEVIEDLKAVEKVQNPIKKNDRDDVLLRDESILDPKKEFVLEKDYLYDPSIIASFLNLPESLIYEFIEEFINKSLDYKDEFYQLLYNNELEKLKHQSYKLESIASNLKIEDALEILVAITTSEKQSLIEDQLKIFYKVIDKLAKVYLNKKKKTATLKIKKAKIYNKKEMAKMKKMPEEDFSKLFDNYLKQATILIKNITDAINKNDKDGYISNAKKLKIMSKNMSVDIFTNPLEMILKATKQAQLIRANINLKSCLVKLSKL
jgi:hypothetical protein